MSSVHLGFIGFGEVASSLSKPMKESGADVLAYDIVLEQKDGHDILRERAHVGGITFCSLSDLVKRSEYILSTVTSSAAIEVAENCAGYLKSGKTYVDLNSTAPAVKIQIANIIDPTGADFVEGAILGAVGVSGANTRILTAGKKGNETAEAFSQWGLNASFYGPDIGKASMFKMLRSIFSKGLEALALELLVAGKRAGIQKELWDDVRHFMTANPFDHVVANWVRTHAVANQRRGQEMTQVAETMRGLGLDPVMTSATESFFRRSQSLGFQQAFSEKPPSMQPVIDFLERQVGG